MVHTMSQKLKFANTDCMSDRITLEYALSKKQATLLIIKI